MKTKTTTETREGYNWKDNELDYIWHHGLREVQNKRMTVYELLSIIEVKMEEAIAKEKQVLLESCIKEIKELEIRTDDGGEYMSADTELMRTEAIGTLEEIEI